MNLIFFYRLALNLQYIPLLKILDIVILSSAIITGVSLFYDCLITSKSFPFVFIYITLTVITLKLFKKKRILSIVLLITIPLIFTYLLYLFI